MQSKITMALYLLQSKITYSLSHISWLNTLQSMSSNTKERRLETRKDMIWQNNQYVYTHKGVFKCSQLRGQNNRGIHETLTTQLPRMTKTMTDYGN